MSATARREPTATPLTEAAEADPGGEGAPGWVEDDFRASLRCGIRDFDAWHRVGRRVAAAVGGIGDRRQVHEYLQTV